MVKRGRDIRRLRGAARETWARRALQRFEASGLSRAAFCRQEGIAPITLSRWDREFGARRAPAKGFVDVLIAPSGPGGAFELELASGRTLRIPAGFDAGDLERLLRLLAQVAC